MRNKDETLTVPCFGTNLLGYIESEKGVGEALRAALRCVRAAGIPHVVNNFVDVGSMNCLMEVGVSESNPFSTNMTFLSPEKIPEFAARRADYFSHRFNIGCWSWELPSIPDIWRSSFPYFQEIWVPSSYIMEALAKVSPIPVIVVPHSIDVSELSHSDGGRTRLGLPVNTFVFLFVFDFHSAVERKNPIGLIEAFHRAFGDRTDVLLLIKSMHAPSAPEDFGRLKEAGSAPNVRVLDAVMSRRDTLNLMTACDCYVSLHRSEGFGLTMAEAMALGKPVVATGHSGNMDFMNASNSFPVRHRLTEIERDIGPYKKGNVWAEPDLDHAAELLKHVFADRANATRIAGRGQKDVRGRYHPAALGALMRERLLAATQEEAVRRSLKISGLQEELGERGREISRARGEHDQTSQELKGAKRELREVTSSLAQSQRQVEDLQTQVSNLDALLFDEQTLSRNLQGEFGELRYRIADRLNLLAKKVPGAHALAKAAFSGYASWRSRNSGRVVRAPVAPSHDAGQDQDILEEAAPVEKAAGPAPRFASKPVPPIPVQTAEFAGCTIVAANYLAQARVLAESFRKHNPGCPFFVLIMGRVDGHFDPQQECFFVVETESLEIPERDAFFFKYNVLEASTAVKPYFLEALFERHKLRKLVYLDPDILITNSLAPLSSLLGQFAIVLTPHLTAPIEDNLHPGEFQILQAGTYNLGFIGLQNCAPALQMISWWKKKVFHHCLMAPERGMHVDQRWVDLVPGLFEGVNILRERGYNVGYWDLHARRLKVQNEEITVNGQPCFFLHFSGFDPKDLDAVSKHQNRFRLENLGDGKLVFERYRDSLLAAGWEESRAWPYGYVSFKNGVPVPDVARRMYWSMGEAVGKFGNPFDADRGSFFEWLNESVDGEKNAPRIVTRLCYEMYKRRSDLWKVFPDVLGVHREAFLRWIRERGLNEFGIDPCFLSLSRSPEATRKGSLQFRSQGTHPLGVNVLGYFQSEKGMGEAVRADLRSLQAAGIPFTVDNFKDLSAMNVEKAPDGPGKASPYAVNLFQVNADQVPLLLKERKAAFEERYNIGYWNWELSVFPEEWSPHFAHFDEIWVPSNFVRDAVQRISPIPVYCVPYAINPDPIIAREWTRARFGLNQETFVFLFSFDYCSYMERKNPLGLVRAFKEAFGDRPDVFLFIKCSHSDFAPQEAQQLRKACQGPNLKIVDGIWPRETVNALFSACDCYVSLHRSEGFGLTLAEAMSFGKPVIATAYSGNLDFMQQENSLLVRYKLVDLDKNFGPYKQGCVWAEPDLAHAAELLRYVAENQDIAASVARKGQEDIFRQLHPRSTGAIMRQRLTHAVARSRTANATAR